MTPPTKAMLGMADEIAYCVKNHIQPTLTEQGWMNIVNALRSSKNNGDSGERERVIEECARELETSYPDHAWLNAACAAIRALKSGEKGS